MHLCDSSSSLSLSLYIYAPFIDVGRDYFHAPTRRKTFVELPPEDSQPGMCGELNQSTHGTRDAAQSWEQAYSEFMTSMGSVAGKAPPYLLDALKEI